MQVLSFPITRCQSWKFPADIIDNIRVWVIFDGRGEGRKRHIFGIPFLACCIQNQLTGQLLVITCKKTHHTRIDFQKIALCRGLRKYFAVKSRTRRIYGITAWHPVSHRTITGNGIQQVDTTHDSVDRTLKIPPGKQGAWMRQGMHFQRQTFVQPSLKLQMIRLKRITVDTDRCTTIDLFQSFKNRSKIRLEFFRRSQVINSQNDHGFDPLFPNPLRGSQFRERLIYIKRIIWTEIRC